MKIEPNLKNDERERKILSSSLAISALVAYFYGFIFMTYKILANKNIKAATGEIGLVLTMFIGMIIFRLATLDSDSSIEKNFQKRSKLLRKPDERQVGKWRESLAFASVCAMVYVIIASIVKLVISRDIKSIYMEIGLLLSMAIVGKIYDSKTKSFDIPKTFSGRPLSTGSLKENKLERYKYYIKEGFFLALFFLPFDILSKRDHVFIFKSSYLSYFIDLIFRSIIFFIINIAWGEFNVKRYNKYYDSLENE